jgi:hypothetical protein
MAGPIFLTGITLFQVGGQTLSLAEDNVKFELATKERTPVMGMDGVVYYTEKPIPNKLSASVYVPKTVDPTTFNAMVNQNIVVKADGAVTLNANNFASTGNCSYNLSDGKLELEFFGNVVTFSAN